MQRTGYQWVEKFQSGKTSVTDEGCLGCPTTSQWQTMFNELMLWFRRTDVLLSVMQLNSWTSAVDLHILLSMRIFGITIFVQDECQSSSWMSMNGHVWKCACNFCSDIVKERLACNGLSQVLKYGCTPMIYILSYIYSSFTPHGA
jgi:hypothetical protein